MEFPLLQTSSISLTPALHPRKMQITLTGPTSDSTGSISKSQNALKSGPPASTPCPSLDDINGVLERLTLEGYGAKVASPMMDFAEQLKQHHALQEDSSAPPPPHKKSDRPSLVVAIGETPNINSVSDPNSASTSPEPDNSLKIPGLPVVLTLSPATPMEETTNPYLPENYSYGYEHTPEGDFQYRPFVDVTRLFGSWNADEAMLPDGAGEECAKNEASASLEVIAESESENDVECERKLNEAVAVAPFSN
ncbi:hypothetical protein HWV62_15863 [Athelia sp. TMB]|nr:hypothetical protein HWV62_15863 [Athelia sp. TMB]